MNRTRTIAATSAVVLAGGVAAAAGAFAGAPTVPPAKPLATAVHDALVAPAVKGITARITFTNKLIDASSLTGGGPLLAGAKGRLWLADDGRARLELQSDRGDAQVMTDGKKVTVYDASSNTAYEATLPADTGAKADAHATDSPPSVAKIQDAIAKLAKSADIAGPTGTNVAGRPAYSVRLSPRHDGGLIGAGELAWDAAKGTPLRAGIYAAGSSSPVLELAATRISYGAVDPAALTAAVPAGAKVVKLDLAGGGKDAAGKDAPPVTGATAVAKAVPFTLAAPDTLVGLPRHEVRLVTMGDKPGALVTYGAQLGGIVVLEQVADPAATAPPAGKDKGQGGAQLQLPKVSIDGAPGDELSTALGTLVRFQRGGVQYTVLGSVPAAAAEAAARGL